MVDREEDQVFRAFGRLASLCDRLQTDCRRVVRTARFIDGKAYTPRTKGTVLEVIVNWEVSAKRNGKLDKLRKFLTSGLLTD